MSVNGLTGNLGNVFLARRGESGYQSNGTSYTVNSSVAATDGQTLSLLGSWTAGVGVAVNVMNATLGLGDTVSLSAIDLADSTLDVQAAYTSAEIQPLLAGNNQLVIGLGGMLDNTGNTITLDASAGDLGLAGGELIGGTVDASGGAEVVAQSGYYSTLDGVTLNSDLEVMGSNNVLDILDGLTLNGTAALDSGMFVPTDIPGAALSFSGSQTLDGSGDVLFDGNNQIDIDSGSTLTIGPGITIRGDSGTIGSGSGDTVINQGMIEADVSGDTLFVSPETFQNEGTIGANGRRPELDIQRALRQLGDRCSRGHRQHALGEWRGLYG